MCGRLPMITLSMLATIFEATACTFTGSLLKAASRRRDGSGMGYEKPTRCNRWALCSKGRSLLGLSALGLDALEQLLHLFAVLFGHAFGLVHIHVIVAVADRDVADDGLTVFDFPADGDLLLAVLRMDAEGAV